VAAWFQESELKGLAMADYTVRVKINVRKLYEDLVASGRMFVSVEEVADRVYTNTLSAGKILSQLEKLGFARKWSRNVYIITQAGILIKGDGVPVNRDHYV
jgi:predicted transcriptional regulator of viral defense system